jgi:Fe-S-cluster containining protein
MMKQLIKHEQCLRCYEKVVVPCCKWESQDSSVVLFAESEIKIIRQSGCEMPDFRPYRNSKTVFQVEPKKSKLDDSMYVCPFLDEDRYMCRIYEMRPFDCRAWPFLFAEGKEAGSTVIACFTEDWCPGLQETNEEDFIAYQKYMAALLGSEKYLQFIKAHRALIWEDKGEDIFPIRDVTLLLKE